MITFKKINLNHSYSFFNDIKNIDPNLLSIDKKCMKNTDAVIYEIIYIMMQIINNQNIEIFKKFLRKKFLLKKFLIFALTENNEEVLELYKKIWSEIKKKLINK